MEVVIPSEAIKSIHDIAEQAYPFECCGFLYGLVGEQLQIRQVQSVVNDSPENHKVHYTIPPKEFMKAERYALEKEIDLIGVFHSHPDHPPHPSGRDLADALPELSYFITSVYQGQAIQTKSWRLSESRQFQEEPIKIEFNK
ncbi:MAG: Mov34/MPN/PAD-1 family protein [Saprospiraceae bacterium]|nr:Mov34/MPN/PAD-1 family protein [Saprospiraceae bacterium]